MGHAILFIGYDRPYPGKDQESYRWLSTEGLAYLKQQEGTYFESMELFALTAHGGDLNGAIILTGDRAKLDELRRQDHFEAFVFKLGGYMDRLGVIPGLNFAGIQQVMKRMESRS